MPETYPIQGKRRGKSANLLLDDPPIGELTCSVDPFAARPRVRDLAHKAFGGAYANYSGAKTWVGGQDLTGHRKETLEVLAGALAGVPGGYDMLYQIAKQQYPDEPLPHDEIFLAADAEKFGPELRKAIQPLIREKLIYQYIGQNRRAIFNDLDNKVQRGAVTNIIDGLVDLYQKVGIRDYDWKVSGPDLINAKWHYFTFDPPEEPFNASVLIAASPGRPVGYSPSMSVPKSNHHPRRSACADAALRAELGRVAQMTIEDRVKAALTMRERFNWLQPEAGKRPSAEK
jgi:hypothetical protein